jgi:DNA-binding NarL/FixJ family response regulator
VSNRVLLVDDHKETRLALRSLLAEGPVEVCGEAANGREAVEQVRELHPDLVVLDLAMPVLSGLEAAYEIRRAWPQTRIIFFSMHDAPRSARTTTVFAADAFVPKTDAVRLRSEIERLLQLRSFNPPA